MATRLFALPDDEWDIVVDVLTGQAASYTTQGLGAAAQIVNRIATDLERQHHEHRAPAGSSLTLFDHTDSPVTS
jgi:hypothetical protein